MTDEEIADSATIQPHHDSTTLPEQETAVPINEQSFDQSEDSFESHDHSDDQSQDLIFSFDSTADQSQDEKLPHH